MSSDEDIETSSKNNSSLIKDKLNEVSLKYFNPFECKICENDFSLSINLPRVLVQCGTSYNIIVT